MNPAVLIGAKKAIAQGDTQAAVKFLDQYDHEMTTRGLIPARQAEEYTLAPGAQRLRGTEVIAENTSPTHTEAQTPMGKLTSDFRAGLISEDAYLRSMESLITGDNRTPDQRENARLENERLQQQIDQAANPPTQQQQSQQRVREDAEKQNLKMLNDLAGSAASRQVNLDKANQFLEAFTSGAASSGAGRRAIKWIPGVWTEKQEFDEAFDAFAEVAARQQLKANGEIRPTDADVKGMKEAMFGIGRARS